MLKFTSIVGYTSCGPTYIESFLTIFGQCINVLNYKYIYEFLCLEWRNDAVCFRYLVLKSFSGLCGLGLRFLVGLRDVLF